MKDNSNISPELLETVERYHNYTMTKAERLSFIARLKTDAAFSAMVDDIQLLLFGIEDQSLKEKLEQFHKDLPIQLKTEISEPNRGQFHFVKIAAAAVIIIALGCFWYLSGSSNERLYNNYFSPDPGLPTTMGTSDDFAFYDAMVNYKQGDYKKAIAKWELLHKNKPDNDTINYFLGVAYLANRSETAAIPFLKKASLQPTSVFKDDANYFLGLAYLKDGNTEKAVQYLKLSQHQNRAELIDKIK